jgi:hypothetical protein
LRASTQLQTLVLGRTELTNAGLEHLKGLSHLEELFLGGTKITEAGIDDLKKSLPHCNLSR